MCKARGVGGPGFPMADYACIELCLSQINWESSFLDSVDSKLEFLYACLRSVFLAYVPFSRKRQRKDYTDN